MSSEMIIDCKFTDKTGIRDKIEEAKEKARAFNVRYISFCHNTRFFYVGQDCNIEDMIFNFYETENSNEAIYSD